MIAASSLIAAVILSAGATTSRPADRSQTLDLASTAACGPPVPIPASILARMTAQFAGGRTAPPPDMTPEDIAADRKMEADQRAKDWPNICRFRTAKADLMKLPDSERRVVFLGESSIQNWDLAVPAYFTQGTLNRGISGQTSPQMLTRFCSDVIALRPVLVHILGGVNAIAGNIDPTKLADVEGTSLP